MDSPSVLQPAPPQGSVLISGVGASHGLGAAIARRFAAGGYPVVIAGRNAEKLAATAEELSSAGAKVSHVVGDASRAADVARFVTAARSSRRWPLPCTMPAQTGRRRSSRSAKNASRVIGASTRSAASTWRRRQSLRCLSRGGGTLIFTGASGSLRGKANFAPFAAAKAAVRALAQSVAREFGPQGIHVGHIVIDGGIEGDRLLSLRPELKDARGPDGLLNIAAIADAYWVLHHQHRSAWTLELDLRPWAEVVLTTRENVIAVSRHAARHEAADHRPPGALDRPHHGPSGPVRLGDDGFIGHHDPFAVEPHAVMAVLRTPNRDRRR